MELIRVGYYPVGSDCLSRQQRLAPSAVYASNTNNGGICAEWADYTPCRTGTGPTRADHTSRSHHPGSADQHRLITITEL